MTSFRIRPLHMLTAGVAALALLAAEMIAMAPRADAAHHLVRILQVYPGTTTPGPSTQEFVVLQLTAANENQLATVGPARVELYGPAAVTNQESFSSNPPVGTNQATVLVSTSNADAAFSSMGDLTLINADALDGAGGAACLTSPMAFIDIDCVEWGTGTSATLPSAPGTSEPAIPNGSMLQRSISSGCPTLHEFGDDTNDSAADFFPVAIAPGSFTPRNNAATITETACAPPGGTFTPPGNPTSPINPAGNVRKRKCKKKQKTAAAAKKKKCKKKR